MKWWWELIEMLVLMILGFIVALFVYPLLAALDLWRVLAWTQLVVYMPASLYLLWRAGNKS